MSSRRNSVPSCYNPPVPTVYAETSYFSECVTIRTGPIDVGRRMTSENWWKKQSPAFGVFISNEVIRELSDPRFPNLVRNPAIAMLNGLVALEIDNMAVCAVHGIDYLLTWNQKHLANPNKRTHLAVVCARFNLSSPQIVTPDLLIMEYEND
jgi:hypothetical protein